MILGKHSFKVHIFKKKCVCIIGTSDYYGKLQHTVIKSDPIHWDTSTEAGTTRQYYSELHLMMSDVM